jgi:CysZ protein
VPVANLLTPLLGIALMVHVHKRLTARDIARGLPRERPALPHEAPAARGATLSGESIRRGTEG